MYRIHCLWTPPLPQTAHHFSAQLPEVVKVQPELSVCHGEKIDLKLVAYGLRIRHPDVTTPPLRWIDPNRPDIAHHERFDVTKIRLIAGRYDGDAWIFSPHNSPYRTDQYHLEVIAPELEVPASGECTIVLLKKPQV